MNELLTFINDYGVQALAGDLLRIRVKKYPNNLWNLSYSQIDSLKYNPIADSCRGTIVRTDDYGKNPVIVARSFKRFYNLGENPNQGILPTPLISEEKLDGTMIILYYDLGHWHVATKKMIYAEGSIMDNSMTFHDLFCAVIECSPDEMMSIDIPFLTDKTSISYVFELTSLKNKVVTTYLEPAVTLLAAFSNTDHFEYSSYIVDMISDLMKKGPANQVSRVTQYTPTEKIDNILRKIPELGDTEEGFVCYSEIIPGKRQRIKIKNPEYVKLHYAANGGAITRKRIMDLLNKNEQAEFLTYFPEWTKSVNEVEDAISIIIESCVNIYNSEIWQLFGKEFALWVKDLDISSILFRMKSTDQTAKEVFDSMKRSYQLALIEKILPTLTQYQHGDY